MVCWQPCMVCWLPLCVFGLFGHLLGWFHAIFLINVCLDLIKFWGTPHTPHNATRNTYQVRIKKKQMQLQLFTFVPRPSSEQSQGDLKQDGHKNCTIYHLDTSRTIPNVPFEFLLNLLCKTDLQTFLTWGPIGIFTQILFLLVWFPLCQ